MSQDEQTAINDGWTATRVRDLSVDVYKRRLAVDSGDGAVAKMLTDDNDGGKKLRQRASSYDALSRCYLEALGLASFEKKPPRRWKTGVDDHPKDSA